MSGSTEKLLQNSHVADTIDKQTIQNERKSEQKEHNEGIINVGFEGDVKHGDGLKHPSPHKRATSFQQKPSSAAFTSANRRNSSPDYGYNKHVKHKPRHSLNKHHRATSASEEDLRRKAVWNSMKAERKFQSVSHLPSSVQKEEENQNDRRAEQSGKSDTSNLDKDRDKQADDVDNVNVAERHQSLSPSSSPRQHQHEKDVLVALERTQLEQYKRRLTLALGERAKLTEKLQFLSAHVSQNLSRSFNSEVDSPRLASTPRIGPTPRPTLTQNISTPRYPVLGGIDSTNDRCLPPLPTKTKTRKIENLNLEDLESSRFSEPTYSERIIDTYSEDASRFDEKYSRRLSSSKVPESASESINDDINHTYNNSKESGIVSKKENLDEQANDIWKEHLSGETFATEDTGNEGNYEKKDSENKPPRGMNDNYRKKPLTVEEFLSSEKDEKKQHHEKLDDNDKEIRRVLEDTSRHTPELYEPLLYNSSAENQKQQNTLRGSRSLRNSSTAKETTSRDYENDSDYQKISTLKIVDDRHRRDHYEEMAPDLELQKPKDINFHEYTRLRRNNQRFNYMNPPGNAVSNLLNPQQNTRAILGSQGESSSLEPEKAPSNISDKLLYYRGKLENRSENYTSRDLADAHANEKDPAKRREIEQRAAAEAAMLRREASALLFEAMNLERICDPNARVRHIYLPQ